MCRGRWSLGAFYRCDGTTWATAFGNGSGLFRMQIGFGYAWQQKFGVERLGRSHQGWIFHFFWAVLGERLRLGWLRSRLYWASPHVHCNQSGVVSGWDLTDLRTGEVCHRGENWQGWRRWRRKAFGCRSCVCFGVEEILTRVTFVSSNREDFQSVIRWCTEMDSSCHSWRGSWYISQVTVGV